jgi:Putative zinc-finger
MDHQEALQRQAVERYLLGELAGPQREEFEAHFFGCTQCEEAVQTGAIFADNARAVFHEQPDLAPAPGQRAPWWQRFMPLVLAPVVAAAALLCLVVYQNAVQIPGLRTQLAQSIVPQVLPSFALHSVRRSTAQEITLPAGARSYQLSVDLPFEDAQGYVCRFLNAANQELFVLKVPRPASGDSLNFLINTLQTPPGQYRLLIGPGAAQSSQSVREYQFALKNQ